MSETTGLPAGTAANPGGSDLTQAGLDQQSSAAASSSNHNMTATATTTPAPLDASKLTTTLTTTPRPVPLTGSSSICSDHMLTAHWSLETGWAAPSIIPYSAIPLEPTASVLHYATTCFEGLKLYRGKRDNKLRLFRAQRNCARLLASARRIALPDFEPAELLKLIRALCALDGSKWLPSFVPSLTKGAEGDDVVSTAPSAAPGRFLYIRPMMFATDPGIGVKRPEKAMLCMILVCLPDLSRGMPPAGQPQQQAGSADAAQKVQTQSAAATGLKAIASQEDSIRAWPGGFGWAKVGANYGPTLVAQGEAKARGFDLVLWLFGPEGYVTEAGASNFFVVWRSKSTGRLELVTAPLDNQIILEGVTRASVLELARARLAAGAGVDGSEAVDVVERHFTMTEIVEAYDDGRLVEAFAAGTAWFIGPLQLIEFRGRNIEIPRSADGASGFYARWFKRTLEGIMYGEEEHEWAILVDEERK